MERKSGTKHFALVGLFALVMTIGVMLFAISPRAIGDKVVIFVSPLSTANEALDVITRADGQFVGMGNQIWIAVASSPSPDFVSRLYQSGALFVGSAEAFSACLPTNYGRQARL